jgi:DegV family protein with EDD domain
MNKSDRKYMHKKGLNNTMNKYIITTDTTCDLPQDYLDKHGIRLFPLYYNMGGTVYGEGNVLDPKVFYSRMRGGEMPTTMAINPDLARKKFTELLDEGYDILHIAFSSALSGSCSVASTVARELCDERPGTKIIVIDSLCASLGEGLLVHKAAMLKESGKTIDETAEWLEIIKYI